mmetsp:Transcript_14219/g.41422  ORF Transcript_14219/g.41422 Transcript_14219/m.41422 type:complete len:236 (-) Transcript_14219:87-794(-)
MSSGRPSRPRYVASACAFASCGSLTRYSANLVGTIPGATQLTRIPSPPSSAARPRVRPSSAVLLTAYIPMGAGGLYAVMDETMTTEPPRCMCCSDALTSRMDDLTLTCMILSMISGAVSTMRPTAGLTAAFCTTMSMRPYSLTAASTNAWMSPGLPTLHATPAAEMPFPRNALTVSSTFCCFLEQMKTRAPSEPSRSAVASPMPAVAPVTIATRPSSRRQLMSACGRSEAGARGT